MSTQDPRMSAALQFEFREVEPGAVLVEQLSALAAAPAAGVASGRRFTKRAAAGVFVGVLLASGTAYAARDDIPVLNAIVGESHDSDHHHAPVAPGPEPSPKVAENDQAGRQGATTPRKPSSSAADREQGQHGDGSGASQGRQSGDTGSGAENAQQSPAGGNGQGQSPATQNDNASGSSGGGAASSGTGPSGAGNSSSTDGDGSSAGQ